MGERAAGAAGTAVGLGRCELHARPWAHGGANALGGGGRGRCVGALWGLRDRHQPWDLTGMSVQDGCSEPGSGICFAAAGAKKCSNEGDHAAVKYCTASSR